MKWCSTLPSKGLLFPQCCGLPNISSRATPFCWFWRQTITIPTNTFATMMSTLPCEESNISKPPEPERQAPVLANDFRRQWECLRPEFLAALDAVLAKAGGTSWVKKSESLRALWRSGGAWSMRQALPTVWTQSKSPCAPWVVAREIECLLLC